MNGLIFELLSNNERVIVPGFGAFMKKKDTNVIYFNEYLKFNDGLLVSYLAEKENIDKTVAEQKVKEFVDQILKKIDDEAKFTFDGVGIISKDEKSKLQFQQDAKAVANDIKKKEEKVVESAIEIEDSEEKPKDKKEEKKKNKKADKKAAKEEKMEEVAPPPPEVINEEIKKEEEIIEEKVEEKVEEIAPPIVEDTKEEIKEVEETINVQEEKAPVEVTPPPPPVEVKKKEKSKKPEKAKKAPKPPKEKKVKEKKAVDGKKKKSKWWLWLIIIIIVIAGGAYAFAFIKPDIACKYVKLPLIDCEHIQVEQLDENDAEAKIKHDAVAVEEEVVETIPDSLSENISDTTESMGVSEETALEEITEEAAETAEVAEEVEAIVEETAKVETYSASGKKYYVIAGCFENESNADKLVNKLRASGYSNAQKFGKIGRLYGVCYNFYDTKQEALEQISKIGTEQAWYKYK